MENQLGFYDTGQRSQDWPLSFDVDGNKFLIKRHLQFFAKGQEVTKEKLKEYFTDKAIGLYEHDGFIENLGYE